MSEITSPFSMETAQEYVDSENYQDTDNISAFRIDELCLQCHGLSAARGWWSDRNTGKPKARNAGELIALMHSELSEALEADRTGCMSDHIPEFTGVEEELADALVRIFDFAGAKTLRLGEAFRAKMEYNRVRKDHSLESRRQEGGKAY